MSPMVYVTMYAWIPIVLVGFALLPRKTAVAIALATGWCFLPVAGFKLPFLPDYTKMSATSIGALLGTLIFHTWVFDRFRLKFIDFPMIIYCVSPFISSVANGLGVHDGVSSTLARVSFWGLPYFIGRLHFLKPSDLRDLAVPIVLCGLAYIPLCLYEVRMSPHLHYKLYGFMQHDFRQHVRYGGYRPMVFMNHGLQVSFWLSASLVLATGMWFFARQKTIQIAKIGLPLVLVVAGLGVTLFLTKSLGALILAITGIGSMFVAQRLRSGWPIAVIAIGCAFYVAARASGIWSGETLIELASAIDENRASSLKFRIDQETVLAEKAREQAIVGWGGWGRNRVYDEYGRNITVVDGLWVLTFGVNGLIGLVSLYTAMIWGPVLMLYRLRAEHWRRSPDAMIAVAVAVVCLLAVVDSLPNAMTIPVITAALGAVASVASQPRAREELDRGLVGSPSQKRRPRRNAAPYTGGTLAPGHGR